MSRCELKGIRVERQSRPAAKRLIPQVCGVLLTLAMAGCPKPPKRDLVVGTLGKEEVLSILNTHADLTKTVRSKLSVKVKTPNMKKTERCEGNLWAEYPDRLRIRGRHDLLDYPPFDIGSDGTTWFMHIHYEELNEMDLGPTHVLDQRFDPTVPLRPRDIVLALGVGPLTEAPSRRELTFSRHPGYYQIDEWVTSGAGRYLAKRIAVDPELMVITRIESYRPDGAPDMIAEMEFNPKSKGARSVPTFARIRLLRQGEFLLELKLKKSRTGGRLPSRLFAVPRTENIPTVRRHGS